MTNVIAKTLATAATLTALATGASAKDWIESFELTNAGIDTEPVMVGASQNGYTEPQSAVRGFALSISGEAESGKRINGITFGAGMGITVKESNLGQWNYPLTWSQIGSGERRTLSVEVSFGMPLTSVVWANHDPVEACEANMADKIDDGWSKEQVLAQEWSLSVQATFSAQMTVARRFNIKPASETSFGNLDYASDYHLYQVFVECAAVPAFINTVEAPNDTSSDNRPGRTFASDRDDDDRSPRPARLAPIQAEPVSTRPSR